MNIFAVENPIDHRSLLREELLEEPFKVESGYLRPPEKPGYGVELNPQALQRFAFSGAEDLALRHKTLTAS